MRRPLLIILLLFAVSTLMAGCPNGIDLTIWPSSQELVWSDDFEQYTAGEFPSDSWTRSGNANASGNHVDASQAASGSQSLRLTGQYTGCWQAHAMRPLMATPPFTIEFSIFLSGEGGQGCHDGYGAIHLKSKANWNTDGRTIIHFHRNGQIVSWRDGHCCIDGYRISDYRIGQWIDVRIALERLINGNYQVTYWINGDMEQQFEVPPSEWYHDFQNADLIEDESTITHVSLASGDSKTWFDDVRLWKP